MIIMNRDQDHERQLATRQSLLGRLKDLGDDKSWSDFYETYRRLIFGMGVKAGLTPKEADDSLQETVITVAKTIHSYRYKPEVTFKGWLRHITRKRIVDQFRKRARRIVTDDRKEDGPASSAAVEQLPDPAGSAFDAMWDDEWQQHVIATAMEKLKRQVSGRDYQIFHLRIIKKQPVGTVAKGLGVNMGLVYLVVFRLSELFKKALWSAENNEAQ